MDDQGYVLQVPQEQLVDPNRGGMYYKHGNAQYLECETESPQKKKKIEK